MQRFNSRPLKMLSLCLVLSLSLVSNALAKEDKKEEKSAFPKSEEVLKNMEKQKGLFTLWSFSEESKKKADFDKEKLYCQIPASFLKQKFMISTSISGGGPLTGFPLDENVFHWEKRGKNLVLIQPETGYVVDDKKTVSDAVRRTYPERIRAAVPIITLVGQDPVIDFGALLKSPFAGIEWLTSPGSRISNNLSKWTKKKAFELNVEIGTELAVSSKSPAGSFEKHLIHYSFWKLPKSNYKSRIADDRIGYFLTANRDWSKPNHARDIFNRYINRWNLEKRDPKLPLCEPKKPIIYYIEKTVPVRYRRAVRDGILEWNKAFEKIGFLNAIEVRQQTNDNEWKDIDPEDMRYSFFRWIVSGQSFAMGPHRANPYTGEIYDADIIFDDSMVRFYENEGKLMLPSAFGMTFDHDPALQKFVSKMPEWKRSNRDHISYDQKDANDQSFKQTVHKRMHDTGHHYCRSFADGMCKQLSVARSLIKGSKQSNIEGLLYAVIKETSMHEVGHTLGLRHNFKASSIYSIDEIKAKKAKNEATTGSVMDYNPILFFKDKNEVEAFLTPTLGPYDYWAIEYGYRPFDENYKLPKPKASTGTNNDPLVIDGKPISKDLINKLPENVQKIISDKSKLEKKAKNKKKGIVLSKEAAMLHAIASRSAEPELAYATDEDASLIAPDPKINRFDMSDNPMVWAKERIKLVDERMKTLLEWSVKDKESWYYARSDFLNLLYDKSSLFRHINRLVGGQYFNRSHKGDPGSSAPLSQVPAKIQRESLDFIEANLFQDNFYNLDKNTLKYLVPARWWHQGATASYSIGFPVHDYISNIQSRHLGTSLLPATLIRIHDNSLKSDDPNQLYLSEYLQRLQKSCWTEIESDKIKSQKWTDHSPLVSSIRRSLQQNYLYYAETLVRYRPGQEFPADIHSMVQHTLRKLNSSIKAALKNNTIDFASEAHLVACQKRIDKLLDIDLQEIQPRRY